MISGDSAESSDPARTSLETRRTTAPPYREVHRHDGRRPTRLESVVSSRLEEAAESGKMGARALPRPTAADLGSQGARAPGAGLAAADLGGSPAPEAARGVANVMVVRRDTGDTVRVLKSKGEARPGCDVSLSWVPAPMSPWCPLACCARVSSTSRGRNAMALSRG